MGLKPGEWGENHAKSLEKYLYNTKGQPWKTYKQIILYRLSWLYLGIYKYIHRHVYIQQQLMKMGHEFEREQ